MNGSKGIASWLDPNSTAVSTAHTRDGGVTWSPNPVDPQLAMPAIPALVIKRVHALVNGDNVVLAIDYVPSNPATTYDTRIMLSADLGAAWREMSFAPVPPPPPWQDTFVSPHLGEHGLLAITRADAVHLTSVCGYQPYGTATPGSGGIPPRLDGVGIPILGARMAWTVSSCVGGAPVVLGLSFAGPASIPLNGITLALAPPLELFGGLCAGPVGLPGWGSASFGFLLPDLPVLIGLRTNWQAAVLDAGAPLGLAATTGVEMFTN